MTAAGIPEATVGAARDEIDAYRAIDVREESEFFGPLGHIPGSELHPLATLPGALEGRDTEERLLLVCRSGRRSLAACEMLGQAGFADVTNLEGGMIAWNQATFPVERNEPKSVAELIANVIAYFAQVTPPEPAEVEGEVARLLDRAGSDPASPTAAAAEWTLLELAEVARQSGAPADLDLVVDTFRRDLAVL